MFAGKDAGMLHNGCHGDRRTWFYNNFHALPDKEHGSHNPFFRNGQYIGDAIPDDGKCQTAKGSAKPVCYGLGILDRDQFLLLK